MEALQHRDIAVTLAFLRAMMMKNLEPMHIKKFVVGLSILIALFSCSSNTTNNKKQSPVKQSIKLQKQTKNSKKKSVQKLIPLTDENLVAQLTAYGAKNRETLVLLKTPKGNMKIKLYDNTPLHRANFIRLIKNDFYKGTMFYRVVNNFMIQGGDSDDWERQSIKKRMGIYTLPAEFNAENIHKKGALSMAREYENNPEKRSVPFEFFIIQGTRYSQAELLGAENEYGIKILPEHRTIYTQNGGCPHLDGQHTVFGQVVEGFNVIDSIAAVRVDEGDWPIENISIEFQILE
jgi:peptidyl-prolyl cis-trans isomerase B (cyclophilin B)